MGGTPWEAQDAYEAWSPELRRELKTPTLVIHSACDFTPETEGRFTALQRRGVPSRLLLPRREPLGRSRATACSGMRLSGWLDRRLRKP